MNQDRLIKQKEEELIFDLQIWFKGNGLTISKEETEKFVELINRQQVLYDIHMANTKKKMEDSFYRTIMKKQG